MPEIEELADVFSRIKNPAEMDRFFREIFTPAERRDFALRWELMKLLRQGLSQREIASRLGVSLCKITRGAKIVKDGNSITNQVLNSM